MKFFIVQIIFLLHTRIVFCDESNFEIFPGAFGSGEHKSTGAWEGREKVISRLSKESETIILSRVTQTEFVVKEEKTLEIYFRFSKKFGGWSPGLDSTQIVDFVRQNNSVTVLAVGNMGYYMARAENCPPKVEPPEQWLPLKVLVTQKWHLTKVMRLMDPYPTSVGIEAGIYCARLNDSGDVEFRLSADDVTPQQIDVFAIRNAKAQDNVRFAGLCYKNGKVVNDSTEAKSFAPFVIVENKLANQIKSKNSKQIKLFCEDRFNNKEEGISWFRNHFQDKQVAEEIVRLIEKAYLEDTTK